MSLLAVSEALWKHGEVRLPSFLCYINGSPGQGSSLATPKSSLLQVCDHLRVRVCVSGMTVCIPLKWGCRRVDVWIYICVHICACLWLSVWLCNCVPVVPTGACTSLCKIECDYTSLSPGSVREPGTLHPKFWSIFWGPSGFPRICAFTESPRGFCLLES